MHFPIRNDTNMFYCHNDSNVVAHNKEFGITKWILTFYELICLTHENPTLNQVDTVKIISVFATN